MHKSLIFAPYLVLTKKTIIMINFKLMKVTTYDLPACYYFSTLEELLKGVQYAIRQHPECKYVIEVLHETNNDDDVVKNAKALHKKLCESLRSLKTFCNGLENLYLKGGNNE